MVGWGALKLGFLCHMRRYETRHRGGGAGASQVQNKIRIRIKGDGQECPSYTILLLRLSHAAVVNSPPTVEREFFCALAAVGKSFHAQEG
jgi:hypothetical protein